MPPARLRFLRFVLGLSVLLGAALPAHAALERELGKGLVYFRVTALPADLGALEAALAKPAVVVDLRYLEADGASAERVAALLDKSAGAQRPRFILVSATTSPGLIALTTSNRRGLLTLAAASPALTPDIAVNTTTDADRAAFDALAKETPLAKLLDTSPTKQRYDEASMTRDHAAGVPLADGPPKTPETGDLPPLVPPVTPEGKSTDSPGDDVKAGPGEPRVPAKEKAGPHDAVLQRAIQIHRALLALQKL